MCREHPNGHILPEVRDEATTASTFSEEEVGLPDECVESIPEGGNPANVSLYSSYSSEISNIFD